MDIAVIGSNNVDLTTYIDRMPAPGETLEGLDFQLGCGGKGANQAVAAARLGSDVLMISRVGNDIFADNTIRNFQANGIDTRYVLPTEATSGVAPIFVDRDGQNSILIVKGANDLVTPDDIDAAADDIASCRLIVLQLEIALETVYYAIEFGDKHSIPVLLNPAPANPQLDLDRIIDCTYVMPNETELALLTGMPVDTLDEVKAAAQVLRDRGICNVIVTIGERGALWLADSTEMLIDAHRVKAVDSSGAGDAFIGCFSHEIVHGATIPDAITKANRYAADSVTKRGTQFSFADQDEFAAILSAEA